MTVSNWIGIVLAIAVAGTSGWIAGAKMEDSGTASRSPAPVPVAALPKHSEPEARATILENHEQPTLKKETTLTKTPSAEIQPLVTEWEPLPEPECEPLEADTEPSATTSNIRSVEDITDTLQNGNDTDRLEALNLALEQSTELPGDMLRNLLETDPSAPVRLLALTTYLDLVNDDGKAVAAALKIAESDWDPAVQAEALSRLSEFDALQQAIAAAPPQ